MEWWDVHVHDESIMCNQVLNSLRCPILKLRYLTSQAAGRGRAQYLNILIGSEAHCVCVIAPPVKVVPEGMFRSCSSLLETFSRACVYR